MTYNQAPHYRKAMQTKQAEARQSPYKKYAKEQLDKYNAGLISADEYYDNVAKAKKEMA
jgi:hypothetical protein